MRVTLIASTMIYAHKLPDIGYWPHASMPDHELPVMSADELAEVAGRACYQSWDRPNVDTATNIGYLNNIILQRHFSVLEHASATFYVAGVSRSLTHELVRHRHLSFSQLSQRYVDSTTADFVMPPALREYGQRQADVAELFEECLATYDEIADRLMTYGLPRKQAREAARAVLPNCTATELVVTGNMRAWRDFIEKRSAPSADAEIQELASALLERLTDIAPNSFQDLARRFGLNTAEQRFGASSP